MTTLSRTLLVLALAGGAGVALAQSQEGVFSAEGVQIRSDARVYGLFAVLNARGLDRETERGPEPTQAPRYHGLRQRLRDKLKLGQDAEKQADAFLRAHPEPVVRYTRAALALDDAPRFGNPEGATLGAYDGLGKVLAVAWNAGVGELYDNDTAELRRLAKEMLGPLDAASADVRARLHLNGSAEEQLNMDAESSDRVVVIINPFDSHGTQLRQRAGGARTVVLGPWNSLADKGVLDPVVVEFARTLVGPEVRKQASLPALATLVQQSGPGAAQFEDAVDLVTEGLARAVAEKVLKRPLVLRVGAEADAEMPLAAEYAKAVDRLAGREESFGKALPALLAEMTGAALATPVAPAPQAVPAPAPAPAPAAPAAPLEAKKPVPAATPAKPK